ncbi:phosphocholine-specific phospholipase C [Sphingomonas quercus]|uniref:Phospholipase C, phosphocholine-specific n=1 Tax=Sphingomonas quercus TaxID=2842451 RepID=A0ABS6BHX8_9SPHN|nr:phospholipase C, phosphocholine-specific [Sphingomonas quercus]
MVFADRRDFLRIMSASGIASWLPGLIGRAAAIPANNATGSIDDVEHIVVFMQENRAFDHYFGKYNGVRGFGDPRPLRLPGGASVWAQPSAEHPDGHVLPYHGDSTISQSFTVNGSAQGHQASLTLYNGGRYDRWGQSRELHKRMLHYSAGDLPFYYALADAFTICDAYHCSTLTQTYPNRLHLFTGCNGGGGLGGDPEMNNYGEDETPSADMAMDHPLRPDAYRWTTYAERLQQAGISWKVYQEYDNFGDNLLSVFPAFRPCARDSELYRRGRSWVSEHKTGADRIRSDGEQLVAAFREDVAAGRLPQVSWIVTAADLSEHPRAVPAKGEHVCAGLIAALVDHPEVFARTVFIINYDEAGGFYDHALPPTPPVDPSQGHSTVPVDGEVKDYGADARAANPGRHPIGMGIRVPAIVVSPWSRGGFVCSELFDHTSVIRFMEQRFGVKEPNIGAWRRSVAGDLTSAFDFTGASASAPALPDTGDFMARVIRSQAGVANAIPARQSPTAQMSGQRPFRPLPYALEVAGRVTADHRFDLVMANRGRTGAVITVHDQSDAQAPWHYTIGAGHRHESSQWHDAGPLRVYDLAVRGPNGLYQRYAGPLGQGAPAVEATIVHGRGGAELRLSNGGSTPVEVEVALDAAYPATGGRTRRHRLAPGQRLADRWPLAASDNWYDLVVTIAGRTDFVRRFAGYVETGRAGRTDPAIGAMRLTA